MMRSTTACLAALFAVFALEWRSAVVSAECIVVRATLEQRVAGSQLVFVADVLGFENILKPESYQYRVRFRVIEAYRGIEAGERAVQFRPTAEDFVFKVPQRVLVYASGTRDNYSTQCTATRVVTLEDPEIEELRRLVGK